MEFMFDTVNLKNIERYMKSIPLAGVTSNPTIIKKEGKIDFFNHFRGIRKLVGKSASLHVQIISEDADRMIVEADTILNTVDRDVFIKIPVTEEGLKAIRVLKVRGVNVTATAVYTKMQGFLAIASGADYIAPYYNRMENMDIEPCEVISSFREMIDKYGHGTKILAASFKNTGQINKAFKYGAHSVTADPDVLAETFKLAAVKKAVDDFKADWDGLYGKNSDISSL